MITILRGNKGNIDFQRPIEMNPEQKRKFIEFMKSLFETVDEEELKNFRRRLGEKTFSKQWTVNEYILLISPDKTNEEVSRKLGRSWMSIEMKRVFYIDEITKYALQKGINLYKADRETIRKLVEEYIKEHEMSIIKAKNERKEKSRKIKEEEKEFERLPEEIYKEERLIGIPGMGITKGSIEAKKKRFEELKEKRK